MKFDLFFLHVTAVEVAAGEKIYDRESKQAGIKPGLFCYAVGCSSGRKMTTEWTGKIRAALWMLPLLQMFWPTQPHALSFK